MLPKHPVSPQSLEGEGAALREIVVSPSAAEEHRGLGELAVIPEGSVGINCITSTIVTALYSRFAC